LTKLLLGRVSPPSRLSCQGSNHVGFFSLAANPPSLLNLVSSQRIALCLAEQVCPLPAFSRRSVRYGRGHGLLSVAKVYDCQQYPTRSAHLIDEGFMALLGLSGRLTSQNLSLRYSYKGEISKFKGKGDNFGGKLGEILSLFRAIFGKFLTLLHIAINSDL
jgi:hypothetical protein